MARSEDISAVRDFNRFYTSRIGLTRGGLYKTQHPLAEARVLYELGANGITEMGDLREALQIDRGQLSRLVQRLDDQGLVSKHASPLDARRQQVCLTDAGRRRYEAVDERSAREVGQLLDESDAGELIEAMRALRSALEPDRTVTLRGLEPGDLGWLVERHGVLYAREYGWDQSFERLVASIAAAFDPENDRAWIATVNGRRAGAVLCIHHDDTTARLRTLLVEPAARGLGLGTRLVNEVIRHATQRGYARLELWTNDVLIAARRVYERAGFTLTHEAPHHAFGHDLTEQTWSLNLKAWTETS
jgi:DNA-binding MarR family transcriptional regulator/ribosomal protein S18 acetylase RimI-like enzyme